MAEPRRSMRGPLRRQLLAPRDDAAAAAPETSSRRSRWGRRGAVATRRPLWLRRSCDGFTLIEMMVAIAILAFGITALIGVLTVGVSTRRSAEQKSRAVLLSGQILHQLQEQVFATPGKANDPAAKPGSDPDLIQVDRVDGFPGMSYQVRFTHDPDHPDLVLALVSVRWREQGETVAEEFSRILRREEPFSRRVSRIRSTR